MEELLPEQKEQLKNWDVQRDILLREISVLKTEQEGLVKTNKELAESNTEIQNSIQQSIGKLGELKKKETETAEQVGVWVAALMPQKTQLETEITEKKKVIEALDAQKEKLEKDIMFLIVAHDDVFDKTGALRQIVEHVTTVSEANKKEMERTLDILSERVTSLLKLSEDGLEKQNKVLGDIPALFVELQRKSLVREKIINKTK